MRTTVPIRNRKNSSTLSRSNLHDNNANHTILAISKSPQAMKFNRSSKSNRRKTKDSFLKNKIQLSRIENSYSSHLSSKYPKILAQAGREKIINVKNEEHRIINNLNKILISSKRRMRESKAKKDHSAN